MNGQGWSLGALVGPKEARRLVVARPLDEGERERVLEALERLRGFSGAAIVGPVVNALNDLKEVFDELPQTGTAEYHGGAFRSRLNGRLSAALTAFTSQRATVEAAARGLALPMGSSAPANFGVLYREHPSYRLVWMLRNIDQHNPPAAAAITIETDEHPETGASRVRPMIDVLAICTRYADSATEARWRRQWEGCAALWADSPQPVDVRAVLRLSHQAAEHVVAAYVREAEHLILMDARHIASLIRQVDPPGAAQLMRVTERDGGERISIDLTHLDPLAVGEAMASLNAARTILGEEPIDEGSIWEPV